MSLPDPQINIPNLCLSIYLLDNGDSSLGDPADLVDTDLHIRIYSWSMLSRIQPYPSQWIVITTPTASFLPNVGGRTGGHPHCHRMLPRPRLILLACLSEGRVVTIVTTPSPGQGLAARLPASVRRASRRAYVFHYGLCALTPGTELFAT